MLVVQFMASMRPPSGVTFRELMKGGFMPQATDPVAGGRAGAAAGRTLFFRVVATIPDAARFVEDPDHRGELGGSVSFDMLGADIPISCGSFQLFAPTGDPELKLMVYRAEFEHGGTRYRLEGAKHVRRRSIVHSWTDTTTLFCRLHQGVDDAAPVVAAGVLRIGALDFARQLASFRTVGAPTMAGKARALGTFLVFFSRELLDTYLFRARRRVARADDTRS
jgi:hypothetical protein